MKIFTPENVPARAGSPKLNISRSGQFTFSKAALDLTGLKLGDHIAIGFDEKSPKDWYLLKQEKGFEIKGKGSELRFSASFIGKKMSAIANFPLPNSIQIGKEVELEDSDAEKVWLLLTVTAKRND